MEEIVKYHVLGGEVNEQFVYLKDRESILRATYPHFSGGALTNFILLTPELNGYEEEKERAETIYRTIKADPTNNNKIEELVIGSRKIRSNEIQEYPDDHDELTNLIEFVSDYEENRDIIKKFFF